MTEKERELRQRMAKVTEEDVIKSKRSHGV